MILHFKLICRTAKNGLILKITNYQKVFVIAIQKKG